jgi:uncharacterized protein YdeI (YjbR/CyaY-like superfamily)
MPKEPSNLAHPKSRAEWRKWLEKNHTSTEGVWRISCKKASGKHYAEADDLTEEALCLGWVDSKPNKLDSERAMKWFAPRKSGTGWSGFNGQRVENLIKPGLITPAGLAKIEAAKKDGSWNALDAIETLEIPSDPAKAFSKNKTAKEYFDAFPRSFKRAILEWISNAKRPETRAARI